MYLRKQSDAHLPRVWIVESGLPLAAAVVAAPILNEWPESRVQSIPAAASECSSSTVVSNYLAFS